MNLHEILEHHRGEILEQGVLALEQARLRHYAATSAGANRDRLARLLDVTIVAARGRDLVSAGDYGRELARERFEGGFDVSEVLTAINVLEEAAWRRVTEAVPAEDFPQALGLVSTVLGAVKQALAVEYVSLASRGQVRSLDLAALFKAH